MAVPRDRPYLQCNFLVDLGDGTAGPDAGFQEVSGLESIVEIAEYRTGDAKENSAIKLAGLTRVTDVTLKRGIVGSLSLYRWFSQIRDGDAKALRTVTITLLDEQHSPVMTWRLLRARPVRHSCGPLNAKGTDVAMEEMTLAYERLELE